MFFPIYDHNPIDRKPIVTYAIIGINIAVWVFGQGARMVTGLYERSLCYFALISGDLLGQIPSGTWIALGGGAYCPLDGQPQFYTLITHMFMHGGWLHIIGNMWFLWIFGDNIENALGRVRFLIFYLICGLAAAAAQIATDFNSVVPMIGASGAVSGVLGAYILLHPRSRIKVLLFFFLIIEVPAVIVLGFYFALQVLNGLYGMDDGIAYWAHIGGFVAGLALVKLMKKKEQTFLLRH